MQAGNLNDSDKSYQRRLVETRLATLLEQARSTLTVDAIKYVIFHLGHTRFREYRDGMLELLDSTDSAVDIDIALPVIQDAWNFFPHQSLNGQSPAEVFESKSGVRPPRATP
jgi:hypothetical protein